MTFAMTLDLMPGSGSAKPLPAKLAARALWLSITGPAAHKKITPAIAIVPNVIIVFDFEVRNFSLILLWFLYYLYAASVFDECTIL
jgi:hypothetical protein